MNRSPERIEFLSDIITTAVEGGTGYWAQVSQYQYEYDGETRSCIGEQVGEGARAVLHPLTDDEDGYEEVGHVITIETIAKGIGILQRGGGGVHSSYRGRILAASAENDAGDIDSSDADIIVQCAVFGETIYG